MNYKKLLPLLVFLVIGLSCSKEKQLPSSPEPIEVKYKIEPNKLGEFRMIHLAKQNGTHLRVDNEPFTEETFYLYAEALLNSMFVDQSLEATSTQERVIAFPFTGEAYNLYALLEYLAAAELAIQNDMAEVVFDHDPQATKFVSIIDVDWSNGGEIYYIVAISPENTQNPVSINMTSTANANCSFMALNGIFQNRVISNWNGMDFQFQYQPDMLFDPIFGTNRPGPNESIPHSTYTEIQRRKVDYADPSARHYYNAANNLELWHRVVPSQNQPAPCMPDTKNGTARFMPIVATATALIGMQLNPNQFHHRSNPNGVAIMGISVKAKSALSTAIGITTAPEGQYEHWHEVTYVYGRQMIYTGVPISNE